MRTPWILLAEDNDDDLALALRAIKKSGVEVRVVHARDGYEVLEMLGLVHDGAVPTELPDLILLDIKMPRLSGIEVLEKLRANPSFQLVPVVMLSSSDEQNDVVESYRLGANSYTVKPVRYEEFISQLSGTVTYWACINRVPQAHPGEAKTA